MKYVLKHSSYSDILEMDKNKLSASDSSNSICASNQKSYDIMQSIIEFVISLHPDIKAIHLGGNGIDLGDYFLLLEDIELA